ncbi:MAG: hypothetical protein Q8N88_06370 [Nanoarchaeota archaeon]|nr:hypothetical protein [Nanoarchaeota archaeon]
MKVVFISSMLPSCYYSQYTTIDLIIYTDKNPKNLLIRGYG